MRPARRQPGSSTLTPGWPVTVHDDGRTPPRRWRDTRGGVSEAGVSEAAQPLSVKRKRGEAMSGVSVVGGAAVTAENAEAITASPGPDRPAGWWRAWRDRFGLAEVCGTLAAAAGFAAGYAQAGSLLAAAARATLCAAVGVYGFTA